MIQAGSKFGKYKIIRQLGAGGMSDVYEALDPTLERHVALKIMPPEFSRDGERIRRFRKEVLAVAALDHPGIVTIFEVNRADGCDYYSMSLARNGNLKQLIHKRSMSPQRSLRIVRSVADALGHAHAHGIVHRDIKPENILFSKADQPLLADFGIVKTLDSDTNITAAGTSVGTPYYMSPEQAQAAAVDTRSDIYSLGVVLFEMLNGAVPYNATTTIGIALQHVNDPVPKLPGKLAVLQPLLERMMAKKPNDRFAGTGLLIEAIDQLLIQLKSPGRKDPAALAAAARAARKTAPPPAGTRSSKVTAPPPAKASKATAPPPSKPAAQRPAPTPPRAVAPKHDPATEFDLMVMTPEPGETDASRVQPARKAKPPAAKPESPAPQPESPAAKPESPPPQPESPATKAELPAPQPESPAAQPESPAAQPESPAAKPESPAERPETPAPVEPPAAKAMTPAPAEAPAEISGPATEPAKSAPTEPPGTAAPAARAPAAPASEAAGAPPGSPLVDEGALSPPGAIPREPAPTPAAPVRPQPPRRRVNTGARPPLTADSLERRQSLQFFQPAGPAWYRRPLTYIIASAIAAIAAAVLLVMISMPSQEPTPLELITGRGGTGAPLGSTAKPAPPAGDPEQAPATPPRGSEPAVEINSGGARSQATGANPSGTGSSRAELLDQLAGERPADDDASPGEESAPPGSTDEETAPAPTAGADRVTKPIGDDGSSPATTPVVVETTRQPSQTVAVAAPGDRGTAAPAVDPLAQRIATLLVEAGSRRAAGRLAPPGENAWEVYREVLELQPGNGEARSGIEEIESAYRSLARAALAAGDLASASAYLESLLTIAPTEEGALALGRQLSAARTAATAKKPAAPGDEVRDSLASGGQGPLLVVISGGTFQMGGEDGENSEQPVHAVSVPAFAIGKYEVTREQFEAFTLASGYRTAAETGGGCNYWLFGWRSGRNKDWKSPGFEQRGSEPVVCVNRADAQAYVNWLGEETGKGYALPSEAQWEFAAAGGAYWSDNGEACRHANVSDLTRAAEHSLQDDADNIFRCRDEFVFTAPVGSFALNAAAPADLLGNVAEWTGDCASADYRGAPIDGSARSDGDCQSGIVRGGSWFERPANVRIGKRLRLKAEDRYSHIGFRVVREMP